MYECRLESNQAVVKLDPIYLVFFREEDEDLMGGEAKEPFIAVEADGMTRVIGKHRYRQTKSGAWRMVDAFGSFSYKVPRDPTILFHTCGETAQKLSLKKMHVITTTSDPGLLQEASEDEAAQRVISKKRADAAGNRKTKKIMAEKKAATESVEKKADELPPQWWAELDKFTAFEPTVPSPSAKQEGISHLLAPMTPFAGPVATADWGTGSIDLLGGVLIVPAPKTEKGQAEAPSTPYDRPVPSAFVTLDETKGLLTGQSDETISHDTQLHDIMESCSYTDAMRLAKAEREATMIVVAKCLLDDDFATSSEDAVARSARAMENRRVARAAMLAEDAMRQLCKQNSDYMVEEATQRILSLDS